jgi:acyl-coenzyme A thioesterase PaaI-like protein
MDILKIVEKAKKSSFWLKVLNFGLSKKIPFNRPHGFKIVEIGAHHLKILVPYRKSNFNHIKGIHACALATVSEFTTGFLLLSRLNPEKYRIIMQSIKMEYHYQAKMDAYGTFYISEEWLETLVFNPLKTAGQVQVDCEVNIYDKEANHISTGTVRWHIKPWEKVRTKV